MGPGQLTGSAVGIFVLMTAVVAAAPGRWTTVAPMPEERTEVAVAALDGRIYVVGGFGGSGKLLEYDPATDRWRERAAPPASLHHAGAVAVGGKLYVVGGYTQSWDPVASTLVYDPARDQWREAARMPTARGALAVAVLGGRIHAVGGAGPGRRNTAAHEVYDPPAIGGGRCRPCPHRGTTTRRR